MSQQIWVVRAGKDARYIPEFLERKLVAIGWGAVGNLRDVHGRDSITSLLKKQLEDGTRTNLAQAAGQLHRFRDDLVQGSLVITYDPSERLYFVGCISGDYEYRADGNPDLQHTRPVSWTGTVKRDELSPEARNSLGSIATIFCISQAASNEIRLLLKGAPPSLSLNSPAVRDLVDDAEADVRKDTEQRALEFLQDRISHLSWDNMQELVAGLLRATGYKPRISPAGADRGRDIVATPDEFGFLTPRIVVGLKHRKGVMGAPDIRSFAGSLRNNDNGLYISTGGFSQEARTEADRASQHVALMDAADLGNAIIEHYDRMDTETRSLLPLKKIYWPA